MERSICFARRAPKPTIDKLHDEIAAIGNEPEFRKSRLVDIGIVPVFDTPEHLAPYFKEQRENGARLIREIGLLAAMTRTPFQMCSSTARAAIPKGHLIAADTGPRGAARSPTPQPLAPASQAARQRQCRSRDIDAGNRWPNVVFFAAVGRRRQTCRLAPSALSRTRTEQSLAQRVTDRRHSCADHCRQHDSKRQNDGGFGGAVAAVRADAEQLFDPVH
jgi:hypothetical protein